MSCSRIRGFAYLAVIRIWHVFRSFNQAYLYENKPEIAIPVEDTRFNDATIIKNIRTRPIFPKTAVWLMTTTR